MQRNTAADREEQRVAGHLQAEIEHFLDSDRGDAAQRAHAQPIAPNTRVGLQAAPDDATERDRTCECRYAEQETSLRRELEVVVVRLGIVMLQVVPLIDDS